MLFRCFVVSRETGETGETAKQRNKNFALCFKQHHFKIECIFTLECEIQAFNKEKMKVGANLPEISLFLKIEATKCVSRTVIQSRGEQVGIPKKKIKGI